MPSSKASSIRIDAVAKSYVKHTEALKGVSVTVQPGEFFTLLGPSGCGKTTLLRIVAGFEQPSRGDVFIDDQRVTKVSPRHRDIAMVFQNYALYPHMRVFENMALNLRVKHVPKHEINQRVVEMATMLHVEHLLKRRPTELSGGEQQRVALGRALIRRPRVFLLDEPLSNLDLKLREEMRTEIRRLHERLPITTIYVTHDQAEAMTLSDRIAVMQHGEIQQIGSPDEIYHAPANLFVARFIGSPSINILHVRARRSARVLTPATTDTPVLPLPGYWSVEDSTEMLVGIRPQDLTLRTGAGSVGAISAVVDFVEHLGRSNYVVCTPDPRELLREQQGLLVETPSDTWVEPGERVYLEAIENALLPFDLSTGNALSAHRVLLPRRRGTAPSTISAAQ